MKSASRRT